MSVSMFVNALRTQSRLRVLMATRVALPATRSINSLAAFRTAAPRNVSLSMSRLFTTSKVALYESENNAPRNSPSPTIFVANIPWTTTDQDLMEVFSEFGEVIGVRLHMNSDGRPRGIAHIDFARQESAVAAVDSALQEPIHLSGRDLRIDFASGVRERSATIEPSEKLYFLGFSGEESEIRTLFQQFGDSIVDIHLLRNSQTGARTPAGFVQFRSTEVAKEALDALNGTQTPDGDTLALSYARPRRNQSFGNSERDYKQGSSQGRSGKYAPRWDNGR